jgi:hypothetical protein
MSLCRIQIQIGDKFFRHSWWRNYLGIIVGNHNSRTIDPEETAKSIRRGLQSILDSDLPERMASSKDAAEEWERYCRDYDNFHQIERKEND